MRKYSLVLPILLCLTPATNARTWTVGPTRQYTAPSKVMSLVATGDTVEIDAGLYVKDVGAWNADSLVLRCSSGYAHLDAQGTAAQRKAIWVINGNRTYVEGIEFSGCAISSADGENGAGIRFQSHCLECRRCYFHDNQEGILTGNDTTNEIFIEACEFDHNGVETGSKAGYEHNIYIGHSRVATIKFCYFHRSIIGHEIKSRANVNFILYNLIADGPDGDGSRDIDLPNGGLSYVIGNSIEKGPMAVNSNVMEYGLEGIINPDSELYFVNNTVVTDRHTTVFFSFQPGAHVTLTNNIFAGDTLIFDGAWHPASNVVSSDIAFFHFRDTAQFDYEIVSLFPGMLSATDPGTAHGFGLQPTNAYRHPLDSMTNYNGQLYVGAFEPPLGDGVGVTRANPTGIAFPNPWVRATTISVGEVQGRQVEIELTDMAGRVVRRFTGSASGGSLAIERDGLPAGVYQCRVTSLDGQAICTGSMIIAP